MIIDNIFQDPRLRLWRCGYQPLAPGEWNHSGVTAPSWHLYWNATPGAVIHYGSSDINLKPAGLVLIAPHTFFSTSNKTAVAGHLYAHFQISALQAGVLPQIMRVPATKPLLSLITEAIHALTAAPVPPWQLSLTIRALIEIVMSKSLNQLTASKLDARVLAALEFLDNRLDADISNADLARQAGMSPSAFCRLFKEQMGRPLHTHINLKRIERACLMLAYTEIPIKQIAAATGFCDRYHFSRVFASIKHISPARYRGSNRF